MSTQFIEFGKKGSSKEIKIILSHIFGKKQRLHKEDKRGTAICIWGTHGLGKTQMLEIMH